MFSNILAVSESTPGPIMVNSATYIGASQAGILGAAVATLGVVLPSFVVIILISVLFTKLVKHPSVQAVLKGVKPCVMGVILATGIYMALEALAGLPVAFSPDIASILLFFLLLSALILYPRLRKKPLSPILLIVLAAGFGILFYFRIQYFFIGAFYYLYFRSCAHYSINAGRKDFFARFFKHL